MNAGVDTDTAKIIARDGFANSSYSGKNFKIFITQPICVYKDKSVYGQLLSPHFNNSL